MDFKKLLEMVASLGSPGAAQAAPAPQRGLEQAQYKHYIGPQAQQLEQQSLMSNVGYNPMDQGMGGMQQNPWQAGSFSNPNVQGGRMASPYTLQPTYGEFERMPLQGGRPSYGLPQQTQPGAYDRFGTGFGGLQGGAVGRGQQANWNGPEAQPVWNQNWDY